MKQTQTSPSYLYLYVMSMLLFGGSFFEIWMPHNFKRPWSFFLLAVAALVFTFALRNLPKEKGIPKYVNLFFCAVFLFFTSDLVCKYKAFHKLRTLWASPFFIVVCFLALALFSKFAKKRQ